MSAGIEVTNWTLAKQEVSEVRQCWHLTVCLLSAIFYLAYKKWLIYCRIDRLFNKYS